MELIDTHCHLDFSVFDNDRSDVIKSCQSLGIQQFIIPGVYPEQWQQSFHLFKDHKNIHTIAGLHPWFISKLERPDNITEFQTALRNFIINHQSIAIGECGLDKMIDEAFSTQIALFKAQLDIANELDLPIVIHHRKTHQETLQLLKAAKPSKGGVIHAFSGSYDIAKQYCDLGFKLGIGGTITYPRANKTREAIKKLPLEALLLETDAPDMPINGKQGERNSPEYLPSILSALSDLLKIKLDIIAKETTNNAQKLFNLQLC